MNERRIARLQELIKARAAEVIDRELSDPRASGLITVTRVELDREMMSCKISWSVYGNETQRRLSSQTLEAARGFVQREIGKVLHTRTVPRVSFVFDESIEESIRLDQIFRELREQRGESEPSDDSEEPPDAGA